METMFLIVIWGVPGGRQYGQVVMKTMFMIVIWGVPVAWILLHLSHHYCRQLFLVYGFGNRRNEWAAKLVHLWRVLQWVQRILLLVCYGLVIYSLVLADTDEACFLLATAVILAGACPDQWRKSGTISYSYFEALVIIACCAATYYTGVYTLGVLGLRGLLVCSIAVIVAIDNALVVRARRTHLPLTFTASIGILSQLLTPYRRLDDRIDHGFEHFHAVCNINTVERDLERVGSGVALALYDFIAHMLAGSLVIVIAWTSFNIVAASSLDDGRPFCYSLFVWIAYGSLICIQAAAVGCVYIFYSLTFQRSNPFNKEEAEIFSRWWCGGALAFIAERAGRWRQTGATAFSNSSAAIVLVPLMANSAQSAIGLLASVQPGIDLFVGWAGAVLYRVALKFPIPKYVVDGRTRTEVMTRWAIKDFEQVDQIRTTAWFFQNFVSLLNCDSDCDGVHYPLLKVAGEFVPTIGRWCTYILLCAGMRHGFTAPLMDVLIEALRHHNEEAYRIDLVLDGGDTIERFEIFGKAGMLRRAMAYIMFVAGLSVSWDVPGEALTYFTLAQCALTVVDAHNDFPRLDSLTSSLEKDMMLVFGPERAITDDTVSTAQSFATDPSLFDSSIFRVEDSRFASRTGPHNDPTTPGEHNPETPDK